MKTVRIGNDIVVHWRIFKNGQPAELSYEKNIAIYLSCKGDVLRVDDYIVDGNTIIFKFPGRKQHKTGSYRLTYCENEALEGMYTTDACDAFILVETCDKVTKDDIPGNVQIETITLSSELTVPADGLSAYEIWLRTMKPMPGHDTEEDFCRWLKSGLVSYEESQQLDEQEQKTARNNIDAERRQLIVTTDNTDNLYGITFNELADAIAEGRLPLLVSDIRGDFRYQHSDGNGEAYIFSRCSTQMIESMTVQNNGTVTYQCAMLEPVLNWVKKYAVDLNTEQTITALKKFTVAPLMQGGLSMAATRIRKLATPVNNDDAANKSYVDTTVAKIPVEAGTGTLAIKTRGVAHNASGNGAIAVGIHKNIASGENSHAEGKETKAYSKGSHAEGYQTIAGSADDLTTDHNYSHSEGHTTQAIGKYSHSEGYGSVANGNASHAEGYETVTNNRAELAIGHFNKSNKQSDTYGNASNTTFSIGIGTSDTVRKNAVEVMQNGDIYVKGVGNYQGDNPASAVALANFLKSLNGQFGDLISRYDMDMEYVSMQMSNMSDLVRGAQQALVYKDYNALIAYLNSNPNFDVLHKGQSIYIKQLDVPDLWISGNRAPDNLTEYIYTNDADFLEYIKAGGWIGCHQLSLLETAKVNLEDYVRNSEVVSAINPKLGGVVCLELGNDKPDNFDEILSILQRAIKEKVHYIISVFDKEIGRHLGEPETIMADSKSYIIQQNRFTSDVILTSFTYRFYNDGTYLRTQKFYDFSQVLNRLDAIEGIISQLTVRKE